MVKKLNGLKLLRRRKRKYSKSQHFFQFSHTMQTYLVNYNPKHSIVQFRKKHCKTLTTIALNTILYCDDSHTNGTDIKVVDM